MKKLPPPIKPPAALIPLEDIRIATPCHADWDLMQGNDRVRFCQSCEKNVYNLSAMTKPEAEALIAEKEGNLCGRYAQRADGTIVTTDCPIPLSPVRHPFQWMAAVFAALLVSITGARAQSISSSPASSPLSSFNTGQMLVIPRCGAIPQSPEPRATSIDSQEMASESVPFQSSITSDTLHSIHNSRVPERKTSPVLPIVPRIKMGRMISPYASLKSCEATKEDCVAPPNSEKEPHKSESAGG